MGERGLGGVRGQGGPAWPPCGSARLPSQSQSRLKPASRFAFSRPGRLPLIGSTVSHYRILDRLGGGGMGVVYRAIDLKLDRPVALKFLSSQRGAAEEHKRRFIREARAASALDHPNICTVYEIDQTADGALFIAMALCEGETLRDRIARGPLAIP